MEDLKHTVEWILLAIFAFATGASIYFVIDLYHSNDISTFVLVMFSFGFAYMGKLLFQILVGIIRGEDLW